MKPKIFITQPISQVAMEALQPHSEISFNPDPTHMLTKAELIEGVKGCDYLFCLLHDVVDGDVVRVNPNLKMIASMAITPAAIDVATATKLKIPVTTVPPITTEATADLAIGLALGVARNFIVADRGLRSGIYPGGQSAFYLGHGMTGKTMGIIGLGRIGEAIAQRARGFDMKVLYLKRTPLSQEQEKELGVEFAAMERLLAESDFVVLAAASTPETRHMIGAPELAKMKNTAYLVNIARGVLVDEKALVKALREGTIGGAGLDVYEREPFIEPELMQMENTVLLPHLGSAVVETRDEMFMTVARNIIAMMEGKRPPNLYNPEIYE